VLEVMINPPGMSETYLTCLNQCFGQWGGRESYDWCFKRRIGGLTADIMILQKEGQLLAGSSVTYRKVKLANEADITVGIMTGSWTLPAARKQGCFTRVIQESLSLAAAKGAALLLAFVTETNASFHRLATAGSALFPTHYLFSGDETRVPDSAQTVSSTLEHEGFLDLVANRLAKSQDGFAHFIYNRSEWQGQFRRRPSPTELLTIDGTHYAVIEKANEFDRVLFLSLNRPDAFAECVKALLKRALDNGRKLFLFTTSPTMKDACLRLGLGHLPGYLTTLVTSKTIFQKALPGASIPERAEDMKDLLYNPDSGCYLGVWDIQSGDRM
jgi:hypothetical protein